MNGLKKAINLAQAGQADQAMEILRSLVQKNEEDLYAWLWLAEISTDVDEARFAARRVLQIRPTNTRAQTILESLGDEHTSSRWTPHWLRPKRKYEQHPDTRNRLSKVVGATVLSLILLIIALVVLTDFPNGNDFDDSSFLGMFRDSGQEDSNSSASRNNSSDQNGSSADGDSQESGMSDESSDVELISPPGLPDTPEALTINWIQDVLSGEEEANISFSCDSDEPSGLQRTLEPLATRVLEYGVTTVLRTLQLDAVFNAIEVFDDSAEYEVDGRVRVTILGQTIESPPFSTVIRFVSDQGEWAICEVTGG